MRLEATPYLAAILRRRKPSPQGTRIHHPGPARLKMAPRHQSKRSWDSNHIPTRGRLVMASHLQLAVRASHQRLRDRLDLASAAMTAHAQTHETRQKTDPFLVNSCRHRSAMCELVLPAARLHLPNGAARMRQHVQQCRTRRACPRHCQTAHGRPGQRNRSVMERRLDHRCRRSSPPALARTRPGG